MAFTFTDRNPKTILHSWGRFKARIYEGVVVGDLLALYGSEADDALRLAEASSPYYAMAIACQTGDANDTITCALAAELKAPVSIATGGIATQAYFGGSTDYVGKAIYLSDTGGEVGDSAGSNTQQVGYYIARDRIMVVPGHILTGTTFSFSGAGTFGGTLGVTGVATFAAQDVHTEGLTVASTKPVIGGTIATPKMTVTTKTSAAGYTITASELLGGFISDTTSTGGIAATLPTVAATVALLPGYVAGTSFRFVYKNPGNQTVTLTTNTTWTMVGTMTIATTKQREFIFIVAGATTGSVYATGETDY